MDIGNLRRRSLRGEGFSLNTITDVEQRLEKVCLPIFKQYELDEENARKLMHEIAGSIYIFYKV